MDNWALEIIGFVIWNFIHEVVLEMIGFTGESTGYCCDFMWTGQTGLVLPVRPACIARSDRCSPRSDRPTLYRFCFRVVYLDIRDYFMIMASRWIVYVCNTVVCY
jgi:hypothetical protein